MAQVTLHKYNGSAAIDAPLVMQAYETSLRARLRVLEPSWTEVVSLAQTHGLSAYDASYLQLALSLGLPLATLDKRLGRVADELGLRAAGATAP